MDLPVMCLYLIWIMLLAPSVRSTVYNHDIRTGLRLARRQWKGMFSNTGENFGGWLLRINYGLDSNFACCGAYYAPLFVITSANCIQPYRYSLSGAFVRATALMADEEEMDVRVDTVYIPDEFVCEKTFMDIAVVRLVKPMGGKLTEFIKLCSHWPTEGTRFFTFAWGYGSMDIQSPSAYPKVGTEVYIDTNKCQRKFNGIFISNTSLCASLHENSRDCLYDGGSPLVMRNELCGVASIGSNCRNTSVPGVYTSIAHVKEYIAHIVDSVKKGTLPRRKREIRHKMQPLNTHQNRKYYLRNCRYF